VVTKLTASTILRGGANSTNRTFGSEFGSRHTQFEMFYAGARFVATGHSYRTFDWGEARGMLDHLLSMYDLDEAARSAAE
jgi:4-hydroxyphenylacetate 3-monooxygenase